MSAREVRHADAVPTIYRKNATCRDRLDAYPGHQGDHRDSVRELAQLLGVECPGYRWRALIPWHVQRIGDLLFALRNNACGWAPLHRSREHFSVVMF
jgi:hypothetical protein